MGNEAYTELIMSVSWEMMIRDKTHRFQPAKA
jgi:hypothetical protein